MDKYAKILFPIFLISIIGIIVYGVLNNNSKNYGNIKKDSNAYLVYTKINENNGNYKKIVPYVNIKGDFGTAINKDIDTYLENYNNDDINITYEYSLSGKVLSIILEIEDHQYAESATVVSVRSYNINLETLELLSNESILDLFSITDTDVINEIKYELNNQYNSIITNKNECNYNCFLERRNIKDYTSNVEYFIKEGKLIAFEPMSFINESELNYSFEID